MTIELTWWIGLLLVAGAIFVAIEAFVAVGTAYSYLTGKSVRLELWRYKINITNGDEE